MSVMGYSLIACGVGLVFCIYLLFRWWARHRRKIHLRETISREIIDITDRIMKVSEKVVQQKKAASGMFDNPRYLTTLITVLVKKFDGKIHITETDFEDCSFEDYVSVQYDSSDNSLYLVCNTVMPLVMSGSDDEPTFH
jgi:transcription antitermination factor NusG